MKQSIGILGFGNMGGALLRGLVSRGTIKAGHALVYDTDAAKVRQAQALGALVASTAEDLPRDRDVILICIKPQVMDSALKSIEPSLSPKTLLISIAAGLSTDYVRGVLGTEFRVVRVMPNTPALVAAGAAGIALSVNCTDEDAEVAGVIFAAVGITERVSEEQMDAITALSGSGPAYFFYVVECLVKAAVKLGLSEQQASVLAGQTLYGAGLLLNESEESVSTLRERVTSPGGTTAAALASFRNSGLEEVIENGVRAAADRSKELGR